MSTIQLRSHLLIPEGMEHKRVLVIGCGTVGSNVALALASIGVRDFMLVDFDEVGVHNIPSQAFNWDQVGRNKANALHANLCKRFGMEAMKSRTWSDKFTPSFPGRGEYEIVVSAADSMAVRKMVAMWARGSSARVIDTRCAGHEIQTWAYDADDQDGMDAYMSTLHSDSEASSLPCGGEMYPVAGLAAAINTLAAVSTNGYFYRLADTEMSTIIAA